MVTLTSLYRYAKQKLGLPYVEFEKSDDELFEILKETTMPTFNRYFPHVNNMALDTRLAENLTDIPNEYWLRDPDNQEIFSVSKVLDVYNTLIVHGYPIDVAFRQFDDIPNWALSVDRAETAYLYSPARMTFSFMPPNKIRVMPSNSISGGVFTVQYERGHKDDLSTLQNQYEHYLKELFLADCKLEIGNIRKKYQNFTTPFGEIPLNGDDLISQGTAEREKLYSEFEEKALPNILIKVG